MFSDELVYIKFGEAGSIITTIGYIILVIACKQSERVERLRRSGIKEKSIYPAKTTAISAWIRVVGLGILAFNNLGKFTESVNVQMDRSQKENISPQFLVTIGAWIVLIGIIIIAIGSQQKAEEPDLDYILG